MAMIHKKVHTRDCHCKDMYKDQSVFMKILKVTTETIVAPQGILCEQPTFYVYLRDL